MTSKIEGSETVTVKRQRWRSASLDEDNLPRYVKQAKVYRRWKRRVTISNAREDTIY